MRRPAAPAHTGADGRDAPRAARPAHGGRNPLDPTRRRAHPVRGLRAPLSAAPRDRRGLPGARPPGRRAAGPVGLRRGHTVRSNREEALLPRAPGLAGLSFGMLGCDLHCAYCQNWVTSQTLRDPDAVAAPRPTTPEALGRGRRAGRGGGGRQHLQRAPHHRRVGRRHLPGRPGARTAHRLRLQRQRGRRRSSPTCVPGSMPSRSISRASTTGDIDSWEGAWLRCATRSAGSTPTAAGWRW